MTAGLKARIAKLESKLKSSGETIYVIGGPPCMVIDPDKPGHLKIYEPPGGFDAYALSQQRALQAKIVALALTDNSVAAEITPNVGTLSSEAIP
ncbi:MAG: hypothetical protein AAFR36_32805 [Bacteroidota bacterium]